MDVSGPTGCGSSFRGILSLEEFADKKADLLSRLGAECSRCLSGIAKAE